MPHALQFDTLTDTGHRFTVCHVDLTQQPLSLFWQDDTGRPFRSFSALDRWLQNRHKRLLFAMNAGMFEKNATPVGLYVENGRTLHPLNLQNGDGNFFLKPNGVFLIDSRGASIIESSRYSSAVSKTPTLATQSGPLLVQNNTIHSVFRPASTNRNKRNGVGIVGPHKIVFVISEDTVNFYDFARLFRDTLGCRDALYLDGYISGLFAPELRRNDHRYPYGPLIAAVGE